jgi:hypothetical protein
MRIGSIYIGRNRTIEDRVKAARVQTAQELVSANDQVARYVQSPLMAIPALPAAPTGPKEFKFDYPLPYWTPHSPKRKPNRALGVDDLRRIADNYDILRACINHLKREVSAVPAQIKPRVKSSKVSDTAIEEAAALFMITGPIGGRNRGRRLFERELIEDAIVVGNCCVFLDKTLAGKPKSVETIDAGTIRPVIDAWGFPEDDSKAYQQWIQGLCVCEISADQMIYDGLHPRTNTPYFISAIEWLIWTVNTALAADKWNRDWLVHGDSPSDVIALPEDWTPQEVFDFQSHWQSQLAGNTMERAKTRFVPSGSQRLQNMSRKDQEFSAQEMWLARRAAAVLGVQLSSIGFAGNQYKESQESSFEATTVFGAGELMGMLKDVYDRILLEFGYDDLEWHWMVGKKEDAAARGQRLMVATGGKPWMTQNEARVEDELQPLDGEEYDSLEDTTEKEDMNGPANNVKKGSGQQPGQKSPSVQRSADLRRWETKVLNRLQSGIRPEQVDFESDAISGFERSLILDRLTCCNQEQEVRSVFARARAVAGFSEWRRRDIEGIGSVV